MNFCFSASKCVFYALYLPMFLYTKFDSFCSSILTYPDYYFMHCFVTFCFHVSGIEVAYQEAVALKRQEELIREEELLENEMKGKRGSATEKDKRSKKKQVAFLMCFDAPSSFLIPDSI